MASARRNANRLDWDWPDEGSSGIIYSDDPQEQELFAELEAWDPRDANSPLSLKKPGHAEPFDRTLADDGLPGPSPKIPFAGVDWSELDGDADEPSKHTRLAFDWDRLPSGPPLYSARADRDWRELEELKRELYSHAVQIEAYKLHNGPKPAISADQYNQLFTRFVRLMVAYFRERGWQHAAEAYEKYLHVEAPRTNTDVVSIPFSQVKEHIMDTPSVRNIFSDWRTQAERYARSQPCDYPEAKTFEDVVEVPVYMPAYAKHVDIGLVLGHYAVSARVAPRGRATLGKMKWQLYFEVTPKSAKFDFTEPGKSLPVPRLSLKQAPRALLHATWELDPRKLAPAILTEVPAVIFWAAETYSGGAEPFKVYSHELSEVFVCDCAEME